jgi:hypothetical protein
VIRSNWPLTSPKPRVIDGHEVEGWLSIRMNAGRWMSQIEQALQGEQRGGAGRKHVTEDIHKQP